MKQPRWLFAPAALVLGLGGGLLLVGKLSPDRYRLWLQEDGPIEWLTVWCFVLAAVVFLLALRSRDSKLERAAMVALAAFCVFVAGEELSWGQRLLTFQPPELFLDKNFQQESNLHNLLKGIFDSRWQVFVIAVGYGVLAPLAAWRRWVPRWLAPHPATVVGAAAVALLELSYPLELSGEVAEALLGMFFVHDAAMRLRAEPAAGARFTLALLGGAAAAGLVMPSLLDVTLYRPDAAMVTRAQAELVALGEHLKRGGAQPRLAGKRRVHKRVFTAIRARYLSEPPTSEPPTSEPASEGNPMRARYQLDPWQQPYWLLYTSRGQALLYSFGPNRRRDSLMQQVPPEQPGLAGDDLGVWVVLSPRSDSP